MHTSIKSGGDVGATRRRPLRTAQRIAVAGLALLLLSGAFAGCAKRPPAADLEAVAEYERINDPLEPLNRYFFEVNRFIDFMLVRPIAEIYRGITPGFVQRGIRNFINNLQTPIILVNDILQGEGERAKTTLARFIINTTVGVGGLIDVAAKEGLPRHGEDFGQTLGTWGSGEGPYLVLPLLGPRPPRDLVGAIVDRVTDPVGWVLRAHDAEEYGYGVTVADVIDSRSRTIETVDELEASSLDLYATVRNLYRQQRNAAIQNKD